MCFFSKWQIEKIKLEETSKSHNNQINLVNNQTQIVASINIKYEKTSKFSS